MSPLKTQLRVAPTRRKPSPLDPHSHRQSFPNRKLTKPARHSHMQASNTSLNESEIESATPNSDLNPTKTENEPHVLEQPVSQLVDEPVSIDTDTPTPATLPTSTTPVDTPQVEGDPSVPTPPKTQLADAPRFPSSAPSDPVASPSSAPLEQGGEASSTSYSEPAYTAPSWHTLSRRPSNNAADSSLPRTPRPTLDKTAQVRTERARGNNTVHGEAS